MKKLLLPGAVVLTVPSAGIAAETVTYTYDALGRVVTMDHQDGPNNNVTSTYSYDAADNRTNVTVQGAPTKVVVVPLNGFTVIPLIAD